MRSDWIANGSQQPIFIGMDVADYARIALGRSLRLENVTVIDDPSKPPLEMTVGLENFRRYPRVTTLNCDIHELRASGGADEIVLTLELKCVVLGPEGAQARPAATVQMKTGRIADSGMASQLFAPLFAMAVKRLIADPDLVRAMKQ